MFGGKTVKEKKSSEIVSCEVSSVGRNVVHNIEGINIDNLKKEKINIYNAREKIFFSNK